MNNLLDRYFHGWLLTTGYKHNYLQSTNKSHHPTVIPWRASTSEALTPFHRTHGDQTRWLPGAAQTRRPLTINQSWTNSAFRKKNYG
jgi:hypothetical protein